jgi:hypothetical protein
LWAKLLFLAACLDSTVARSSRYNIPKREKKTKEYLYQMAIK